VVERLRDALLDGQLGLAWSDAVAVVTALLLFAGGHWIFRRLSPHFEDFV
jgi:ABC-type polysaccharide/polyol phosphate export permease